LPSGPALFPKTKKHDQLQLTRSHPTSAAQRARPPRRLRPPEPPARQGPGQPRRQAGEYHYNCPLDQQFFAFTGIDHEVMLAEIKGGKTDVQLLEWVGTKTKRLPFEIASWSAWVENYGPGGAPAMSGSPRS